MSPRSSLVWSAVLAALCLALCSSAFAALEVWDDQARFSWTRASGPVEGYVVYVSRNDNPEEQHSIVNGTEAVIEGAPGDSIVVRVAAFNQELGIGPLSEPSEPVQFALRVEGTWLDFDGDGRSDVLAQHGLTAELEAWHLDGNGLIDAEVLFSLAGWPIVAHGDYNGDGQTDLVVWGEALHILVVLLLDGPNVLAVGTHRLAPVWGVVGSGDYNGNGTTDLLLRNLDHGALEIRLLNGTALRDTIALPKDPGPTWDVVDTGDYDGDGRADVLWYDSQSTAVMAWLLEDTGARPVELAPNTASSQRVAGGGDFDGDGRCDVVWRDRNTGALTGWLLRDGMAFERTPLVEESNPERELLSIADYDGDGRDELLLRASSDGPPLAVFQPGLVDERVVELPALGLNWSVMDLGVSGSGG